MLRNVNEEFAHSRKNEMQTHEKLNSLKHEYERVYNENMSLKTEVTSLGYKDKERTFEIE